MSTNMNKRILIAGGAGFIGSNLTKHLLENGNEVICIDNLSTGVQRNIQEFLDNKNYTFIHHDVINPIDIKVDEIYNLASPASPPHYQLDPIQTLKTSVLGSINLLELARKNDAIILQASTSEVYGDPEMHPQKESYNGNVNPIGIRSCYDEGKRCAETLFFDYQRVHGVRIRVVRIFNTYGPNMDANDGRVVSNFITQALANKNITIYGDGTQTRSFCYVDDMVNGLVTMMEKKNGFCGPVNLGNDSEFTVNDLADKVLTLTESKSKLSYKVLPEDDPKIRRPDLTVANEKLNWFPRISLEEGLNQTIAYFKK
jgi:UDP-glucuronate decarboxylase